MKTRYGSKSEYETAIASAIGHEVLPTEYWDLISTLTAKTLDVILAMIEEAASGTYFVGKSEDEDVAKLQLIEEAARKSHGKLADTILAIIASGDFAAQTDPGNVFEDNPTAEAAPGNFLEDDPDNFLEEDDAPD